MTPTVSKVALDLAHIHVLRWVIENGVQVGPAVDPGSA